MKKHSTFNSLLSNIVNIFNPRSLNRCGKLKREEYSKNIIIHKVPNSIMNNDTSIIQFDNISFQYKNIIKNFLKELRINLPYINFSAFYRNLSKLRINVIKYSDRRCSAYYDLNNLKDDSSNEIVLIDEDVNASIYHELLHVASSRVKGTFAFSGFSQSKLGEKPFHVGKGLNEGYTDLLSNRYYSKYGATVGGYPLVMNICQLLELLLGRENMTMWYFNSSLYDFNMEMRKYFIENEMMDFYFLMDFICDNYNDKKLKNQVNKAYHELLSMFMKLSKIRLNELKSLNTTNGYSLYNLYRNQLINIYTKQFITKKIKYNGFDITEIQNFLEYFPPIKLDHKKGTKIL